MQLKRRNYDTAEDIKRTSCVYECVRALRFALWCALDTKCLRKKNSYSKFADEILTIYSITISAMQTSNYLLYWHSHNAKK